MVTFPNAKINIGLNILSRRTDGYHNLETIFYPVKVKDVLEVIEAPKLKFESSGIEIPGNANENLCLSAYQLLKADFDIPPVYIHLHKNIPIGAGLGGGSADAAFFIKLMNDKFNLGLNDEKMENYCRKLGADCAFFIQNKPLFAYDKGDFFEPIEIDLSSYFIVLVMPPVHVSTGEAYRSVKPQLPKLSLKDLVKLPIESWQGKINNDFEPHILNSHPQIRGVKRAMLEAGALFTLMSGSGASVFGIFKDPVILDRLPKDHLIFYNI